MAKMYSLVMGIENYPEISGQTKVNYAGNDVKAMADYARQAGFHLIDDKPLLDEDVTRIKIIDNLEYLFDIADEDDFILLYFAGHGCYSKAGGFIIPFDYQQENKINEGSCISFRSINDRLQNKKTNHFIFFLDMCHSGYAGKQIDIRAAKSESRDIHTTETEEKIKSEMEAMLHKDEISQGVGRLIFTSSAPNEKSYHTDDFQHGLFTHFLLSGLKPKTNEKQVNVEDLVHTVKAKVADFCFKNKWKQTPTSYLNIEGAFFLPAYETQPPKGKIVPAPDFSQGIEKARKALQSKDFDSAARIINTVLQKDRLNLEAKLLLEELDAGRNLQLLKEKSEIRQNYEEWLRRGEGFRKAGEFSKAKECFENAARIYPDNPLAQSYLKEIDTRQQIIKLDDIEAPEGDKAVILKNLFQSANDVFNKEDFTAALNYYNKILKTYPGNQRAIKEKIQLFGKWLQQYKDSARYFEMLGLLENIILPDESLREDYGRFEEEYNETVLLYTQVFLKSRISTEIEPVIKEIENKRKRIDSYEKLLVEYHELAMDAEYDELLKLIDKIKSELAHISDQIKLKSEIIETKDIFKTEEKALSDYSLTILESLINKGITDKYILIANEQIVSEKARLQIDKVNKMPEKGSNQISKKCEAFNEFKKEYPGKLIHKINSELTRLTQVEFDRIKTMSETNSSQIAEKIKAFNEFQKEYPGRLTEEIKSELTRLTQAEFDRIKTMPETNSSQISEKIKAFTEFQKEYPGKFTDKINSELTRLTQAEFDRIKTRSETNSSQISEKIKAFNEFQKEYPGKFTDKINSELTRLTQAEFARIKSMSETNSSQISEEIKAFNEFQKEYPGRLTEEINSELIRLNIVHEKIIAEETQVEFDRIKTMPENDSNQISKKCEAFNGFQKEYPGRLTEEINSELTSLISTLKAEETQVELFGRIITMPEEVRHRIFKWLDKREDIIKISAKIKAFNEFQKKYPGKFTEQINNELTRLNQPKFDRLKTMPETNSFQISRKIKAFNEFQKEYSGKLTEEINSELKRLNIVHEKIIDEETQAEFDRIKTKPETISYQISEKTKAFNEFQKKYPGKFTDKLNSELTRLNSALEIKNTQAEFDRIKTMPETNTYQISEKIKAFNEFQKKYPIKFTEEINRELTRLNLFLDIVEIFGMQVKTVKGYKNKLKSLRQIDQTKYDLLKNNIISEIVSVEFKLKEQENVLWNRRYKKFDIFLSLLLFLLNSLIWIIISTHYFKKGGFFNILGCIVGGILVLISFIILLICFVEDEMSILKKRYHKILFGLGKFGITSSIPITC